MTQGAGFRHKGQCSLCQGKTPGIKPQGFPVGKGVVPIAGFKLCKRHAARVQQIAAQSSIVWPTPMED